VRRGCLAMEKFNLYLTPILLRIDPESVTPTRPELIPTEFLNSSRNIP
jgi:hypothetical protein